jgi:hypothetical protein
MVREIADPESVAFKARWLRSGVRPASALLNGNEPFRDKSRLSFLSPKAKRADNVLHQRCSGRRLPKRTW